METRKEKDAHVPLVPPASRSRWRSRTTKAAVAQASTVKAIFSWHIDDATFYKCFAVVTRVATSRVIGTCSP